MEGIAQIVSCSFFHASYVQVYPMNFLHRVLIRTMRENVRKTTKTHGKNKWVEEGSDSQTALGTKKGKLVGTWKEQTKSASEDDKPFLVELIQTVVSTVETRHPIPPSRVTHLVIYIFFSSVLLHYSLNVHRRLLSPRQSLSLQALPLWLRGRRKGRINNVTGPVIRDTGGEWNWRQSSFSDIMSPGAGWCQSSWCHWGWLWSDPRSPPVVFAPTVPEDMDQH